ncbi:hypothetical protein [Streptomyces triticisoli]|jgi:hypothetical protein|uniref:hypothetical protein n=1 Tax=Streptomyces triticisoli TaxID=2182797 RepID=UPI000DD8D0F2|nr:hypothetical protein [Streptomyces triticisoli]
MRSRTARPAALAASAALLAGGLLVATVPAATAAPAKYSHAAAAQQLKRAGITWTSSGGCSNRNNSKCTSFEQINKSTVAGVIDFKKVSKCAVTLTAGTERGIHRPGRYSHENGYKVDIRLTPCVNSYITRTFRYVGERGDRAKQYKSPSGNIYAREGSHWDVTYYRGSR